MARIEWIKHRLDNWALWKERESRGGLGYATSSVLLSVAVDHSREIALPVDEVDAAKTDRAVESLRAGRSHLYMTLQLIYVQGIGVRQTAAHMGRAESTIKANLDQADHALQQWFTAKAEEDAARRAAMTAKRSLST